MSTLEDVVRGFAGTHALVVGDVMVDEYLRGDVERVSPEAPVPVVRLRDRGVKPGGAANVALNVAALGASAAVIGLRGADEAGQALGAALDAAGLSQAGLVETGARRTTRKARVMSQGQQLLRVDTEDTWLASDGETEAILAAVRAAVARRRPDVLVIQDYDKGAVTPALIGELTSLGERMGVPIAVDPKARNFWEYTQVALFKPNLKELTDALAAGPIAAELADLARGHEALRTRLSHARSLITLGAHGAYLGAAASEGVLLPAHPREIVDVCGAGDSVIAAAALALGGGASDRALLELANLAGGLACEHVGVRPVTAAELLGGIAAIYP